MTEATTKFIQVRSSGQKHGHKKVYTRGYASTKGLYDKYSWMKKPDGSF